MTDNVALQPVQAESRKNLSRMTVLIWHFIVASIKDMPGHLMQGMTSTRIKILHQNLDTTVFQDVDQRSVQPRLTLCPKIGKTHMGTLVCKITPNSILVWIVFWNFWENHISSIGIRHLTANRNIYSKLFAVCCRHKWQSIAESIFHTFPFYCCFSDAEIERSPPIPAD